MTQHNARDSRAEKRANALRDNLRKRKALKKEQRDEADAHEKPSMNSDDIKDNTQKNR